MGGILERCTNLICKRKEIRLVMVGLMSGGKTTILYQLKLGKVLEQITSTVGFTVETIKFKNLNLVIWEMCDRQNILPLWKYQFENTPGFIFVVDSSDNSQIHAAKELLHGQLSNEHLKNSAILILANKNDKQTMKIEEITEAMELEKINQKWLIQSTCGLTGEGLLEGIQWITDNIQQ